MTHFPQNISIQEIEVLAKHDPYLSQMIGRIFSTSFEDFINILYKDIDLAIFELESNCQLMQEDSEDKLSAFIVSQLKRAGYNASLGTTGGGNKDITVLGKDPSWSWIGEAKKYLSVTNLHEALLQLATRYKNVDVTKAQGGILAYIFRPNASKLMSEWKDKVGDTKTELNNLTFTACPQRSQMAFYTSHNHSSSGLPFVIRHMGVALHFAPEDKSARNSKKYKPTLAKLNGSAPQ